MNYEINVSVFPPAGAGILQIPDGKGGFTILPAPAVEYKNVISVERRGAQGDRLELTLRAGDKIETNLPYIIRHILKVGEDV